VDKDLGVYNVNLAYKFVIIEKVVRPLFSCEDFC